MHGLKKTAVAPVYLALKLRGDRFDSNAVHYYLPERGGDGSFEISARPGLDHATVFVDLGRVMPGTVEIETDAPAGTDIEFGLGEALEPLRFYPADASADGSRRVFRPSIAQGGWTGLRYAWIRFWRIEKPFRVSALHGVMQLIDAPREGSFECSDERLNRIWELCTWSAHTVMGQPDGDDTTAQPILQTFLLDRCDRHPWAGDSRFIQATVGYVFGQYDLIKSAIERMLPTGIRPIPDLQDIPPYTFDWALGLLDYHLLSGDADYLRQRWPDLQAIVEKFAGPVPAANRGYGLFFDWDERVITRHGAQPPQRPELEACFTGKHVQFLRELARAAKWLNDAESAQRLINDAEERAQAWHQANPGWAGRLGLHAVTNLIVGGVLAADDWPQAYAAVYDTHHRWTSSPYFTAQIVGVLGLINRHTAAVELLHDYYGAMLDAGATTVWEEFDPDWKLPVNAPPPQFGPPATWAGLSLNHPVGSTPARWLLTEILGVKPATPGFRRVSIKPHGCGLAWAHGSVATPQGPITVEWQRKGDRVVTEHQLPQGVQHVDVQDES